MLDVILQANRPPSSPSTTPSTTSPSARLTVDQLLSFGPGNLGNAKTRE
jgi:hypothetical protein